MPANPTKALSPAELAKLEHAFASNPTSEAYKPLAEAYLGMGRFMEAMVVCKKGVKAHPGALDARMLLARVYAEQGKEKKALEELMGGLQIAPTDPALLRMIGSLQLKSGETEAGKATLLKAHEARPNDPETRALMEQYKIELPKPASPPRTEAPAAEASSAQPRAPQTPGAPVRPSRPTRSQPSSAQAAAPAQAWQERVPRAAASRPALMPAAPEWNDAAQFEIPRRTASSKNRRTLTFALLILGPVVVVTYLGVGRWRAYRNREINKYLNEATEQLKHDSYASYKKACQAGDKVLELDPTSTKAHACLAYAYAIRWGEHGGGDEAHRLADEHLQAAKKGSELRYFYYSAEALIDNYSGKVAQALSELKEHIKFEAAEGRSESQSMFLTLGLIQMNAGDFEDARDSLEKAQALAPDDPRIYSALGSLSRRRGQDQDAWRNFESALRYEKDHPESLLGKALLILEQDRPDYAAAAKILRRLIDADPPPSPRQLAMAHLTRSLLISRVSAELPEYRADHQKLLSESTGVPLERTKAQHEVVKAEETGFTLDRQNPELRLIKGRRLLSEGNVDAAAAEFRQAIRMDPSRAHFHIELARALLQKPGGEKEAHEALTAGLRTMPSSPKLIVLMAQVLRREGKLDEALAQYQQAFRDPKARNPEARLGLGSIYREKKDYPKAIEALEKAVREFVGQSWRVAATYTELGRAYEEKGDRAKAEETFQKALNTDADYAQAYFFYARFLAADGRTASKARTTAQEYLKREPKGEYAAEAQKLAL